MVKFPSKLEEIVPPAAVTKVLDLLSQPALTNVVRETLNKVGIKEANPVGQVQEAWRQARGWFESVVDRVLEQHKASPAAINASGVLFDPRWSSLPMDSVVVQALVASAVSFQDQQQLNEFAAKVVADATGGAAAMLTTSPAACLALLSECEAFHGGLIIPRTDVLRIPGRGDVRALLAGGKNSFTDIGAVNGAAAEDWEGAVISSDETVLLISPNSLETKEASTQRSLAIQRAKSVGAKVVELLFDATIDAQVAERIGVPLLSQSLATGADVVIAPLDGLLSGPAGALIAGREDIVASMRTCAQVMGCPLQGPSLAGAAAAVVAGSATERPRSSIVQMLLTNNDNLKDRARRLAIQLNNTKRVTTAEAAAREARLGPSPWNRYQLSTHVVVITPRDQSVEELARDLSNGKLGSSIWVKAEDNAIVIDLRFVEPADDHKLVEALMS